MEFFYLLLISPIVGVLSSLFGIGGGSIIVPVLYLVFPNFSAATVISTSLCTIFFNSTINCFHYRSLLPKDSRLLFKSIILTSLGALLGGLLLKYAPKNIIKNFFALALILSAFKNQLVGNGHEDKATHKVVSFNKVMATGYFGGLISSLTGLGGGVVFVPLLKNYVKLPLKLVSPYSNGLMVIATLLGVIPHLFTGHGASNVKGDFEQTIIDQFYIGSINPLIVLTLFLGSFPFTKLGARLNSRMSQKTKNRLLSTLLIVLAIKVILSK